MEERRSSALSIRKQQRAKRSAELRDLKLWSYNWQQCDPHNQHAATPREKSDFLQEFEINESPIL